MRMDHRYDYAAECIENPPFPVSPEREWNRNHTIPHPYISARADVHVQNMQLHVGSYISTGPTQQWLRAWHAVRTVRRGRVADWEKWAIPQQWLCAIKSGLRKVGGWLLCVSVASRRPN